MSWDGHERRQAVSSNHDLLLVASTKLDALTELVKEYISAQDKINEGTDKRLNALENWKSSIKGSVKAVILLGSLATLISAASVILRFVAG